MADSGYGLGPYGGVGLVDGFYGAVEPLAFAAVWAMGPRTVRVQLTRGPQRVNPYAEGDVYRPLTWSVVSLRTGAPMIVVGVIPIEEPLVWDLRLRRSMLAHPERYRLAAPSLRTPDGAGIEPPTFWNFTGSSAARFALHDPNRSAIVDLKNESTFGQGRALQTGAGSYATHDKVEALKKRLHRMVITEKGTWPGAPNFGLGARVKELIQASDYGALKRSYEEAFLQDPEVRDASVRLEIGNGVLMIHGQVVPNFQSSGITFREEVAV